MEYTAEKPNTKKRKKKYIYDIISCTLQFVHFIENYDKRKKVFASLPLLSLIIKLGKKNNEMDFESIVSGHRRKKEGTENKNKGRKKKKRESSFIP